MDIIVDAVVAHFYHLTGSHQPSAHLLLAGSIGQVVVLVMVPSPIHAPGLHIGVVIEDDWAFGGTEQGIDVWLREYLEPGYGLPFTTDGPDWPGLDTSVIHWDVRLIASPAPSGLPATVGELRAGVVPASFSPRPHHP